MGTSSTWLRLDTYSWEEPATEGSGELPVGLVWTSRIAFAWTWCGRALHASDLSLTNSRRCKCEISLLVCHVRRFLEWVRGLHLARSQCSLLCLRSYKHRVCWRGSSEFANGKQSEGRASGATHELVFLSGDQRRIQVVGSSVRVKSTRTQKPFVREKERNPKTVAWTWAKRKQAASKHTNCSSIHWKQVVLQLRRASRRFLSMQYFLHQRAVTEWAQSTILVRWKARSCDWRSRLKASETSDNLIFSAKFPFDKWNWFKKNEVWAFHQSGSHLLKKRRSLRQLYSIVVSVAVKTWFGFVQMQFVFSLRHSMFHGKKCIFLASYNALIVCDRSNTLFTWTTGIQTRYNSRTSFFKLLCQQYSTTESWDTEQKQWKSSDCVFSVSMEFDAWSLLMATVDKSYTECASARCLSDSNQGTEKKRAHQVEGAWADRLRQYTNLSFGLLLSVAVGAFVRQERTFLCKFGEHDANNTSAKWRTRTMGLPVSCCLLMEIENLRALLLRCETKQVFFACTSFTRTGLQLQFSLSCTRAVGVVWLECQRESNSHACCCQWSQTKKSHLLGKWDNVLPSLRAMIRQWNICRTRRCSRCYLQFHYCTSIDCNSRHQQELGVSTALISSRHVGMGIVPFAFQCPIHSLIYWSEAFSAWTEVVSGALSSLASSNNIYASNTKCAVFNYVFFMSGM